jgi:hypothetical protein
VQGFDGVMAALWLGLLWYAAPLVGAEDDAADRVRGVLVLGVLVPLILGFAHLLYAPALIVGALALCAIRRLRTSRRSRREQSAAGRRPRRSSSNSWTARIGMAIPVFVAVAAAWSPLVRPLLEGDSLAYHLPNAAAWVQSGSVWETGTRYWWYPGGSELFAAGLLAVSGAFSLGLAGLFALLLLGLRIRRWAERLDAPPLAAGALAGATLATLTIGLQAGNLENDVWLGAFFLEVLYDARFARGKIGLDAAVCALVKPYGFAFAAYGLVAARRLDAQVLVPLAVFGVWVWRDVVLWHGAIIPPQTTVFPELFRTTIVANAPGSFVEVWRALARDGPWLVVLAVAPLLGLFAFEDRALCVAGVAALVGYLCMPFSYRNYISQLGGGESLRFALPAFAVGAVVSVGLLRRIWLLAVPLLLLATLFELRRITGIFWIDPNTHIAFVVAAAFALALLLPPVRARVVAAAALAAISIVFANASASRERIARYDEWLGRPPSKFFEWLAVTKPARLVASDVSGGAIVAISAPTRTFDVLDLFPCDEARNLHALLLYRKRPAPEKTIVPWAQAQFRNCGPIVYDDDVVRVLRPPGT